MSSSHSNERMKKAKTRLKADPYQSCSVSSRKDGLTPPAMKTMTGHNNQGGKKASKQKKSSLPQCRLQGLPPPPTGRLEGLAPDLGRAPPPYRRGCWSSFPWEPGLPSHPGLWHVEERGGWEAPQRGSESSLFSKLSPERASLTPLCQTILQWNQVFDVMDWEGGINRAPQRDNQDDCPALEIRCRAFLKPQIRKQVIIRSQGSSYPWTLRVHQEAGRSCLFPASLLSLKFALNGQIWVSEWKYVALIKIF